MLADVFGQNIHLLHGHVQHIPALVFDRNVFLYAVGGFYFFSARNFAHAVLFVHAEVAYLGRGKHIAAALFYALCNRLNVQIAAADYNCFTLVQNYAVRKLFTAYCNAAQGFKPVGHGINGQIFVCKRVGKLIVPRNAARERKHAIAVCKPAFAVCYKLRHRIQIGRRGRGTQIICF